MLLWRVTEATHTAYELSAQSDGMTSADFRPPSAAECRLLPQDTHLTQFINLYILNDLGVRDKTPRGAIIIIVIVIIIIVFVVVAVGTGVGG
jgi:hypothetical protein